MVNFLDQASTHSNTMRRENLTREEEKKQSFSGQLISFGTTNENQKKKCILFLKSARLLAVPSVKIRRVKRELEEGTHLVFRCHVMLSKCSHAICLLTTLPEALSGPMLLVFPSGVDISLGFKSNPQF